MGNVKVLHWWGNQKCNLPGNPLFPIALTLLLAFLLVPVQSHGRRWVFSLCVSSAHGAYDWHKIWPV